MRKPVVVAMIRSDLFLPGSVRLHPPDLHASGTIVVLFAPQPNALSAPEVESLTARETPPATEGPAGGFGEPDGRLSRPTGANPDKAVANAARAAHARPRSFARIEVGIRQKLVLNIFDCRHKRMTRPMTPINKTNAPEGATYVVCLDCGRQFVYDLKTMRVGARVPASPATGVLDSDSSGRKNALRYAVIASIAPLIWGYSRFLRKARRSPTAEKP
jgi:hypothetical protein